ncbi:hypothetical protein ABK040_016693, partial [Willaertia magna]
FNIVKENKSSGIRIRFGDNFTKLIKNRILENGENGICLQNTKVIVMENEVEGNVGSQLINYKSEVVESEENVVMDKE